MLALPLLATLAHAQRAIPRADAPALQAAAAQKLPAPQAPIQAPVVRDAQPRNTNVPVPSKPTPRTGGSERMPHDRLYLTTGADGAPQAHGSNYKALFGASGATFVPYCGAQAPQNHPIEFHLASITAGSTPVAFSDSVAASLAGQRISYSRGGVTEVYELGVDSMEQKFVFDTLPASGDLSVRLALGTEMSVGFEGSSIVFGSADGSVRYGAATVVDASGASVAAPTEIVAGGLEIRVPAEFLSTASFPVTIDPVITTFNVNWGQIYDDFAPSVAWDETNQRTCTVCEETFSATDHDVIFVFSDAAGNFIQGGYVETGLDYYATPDVANNNNANVFYAVAAAGQPTGGIRTIRGRTIDAATGLGGTDTEISVGTFGEDINPSVGGDPFLGTSYFTVVWQRLFSPGVDEDIVYRQVDPAGVLQGTGVSYIDNSGSTLDQFPRISKSCLGSGYHHVVWQRTVAPGDADIYGAEVLWNGTINIASTALVTGGNTPAPNCSPIDNSLNWLLVYEYDYGDHDIVGAHMSGLTINNTLNISWREYDEGGGLLFQDQRHPAADTDGNHFAVSYSEQFSTSTTDYDMYVDSIDYVSGFLRVGEFHQNIAYSGTHEDYPNMCSNQAAGGSGNNIHIVWSDDTGATYLRDVEAAVYGTSDFTPLCFANVDGSGNCPCANAPTLLGLGCNNSSATGGAALTGSGNASISADTAVLSTYGEKPTATSVVAQGPGLNNAGLVFGQGLRCASAAGGIGLKRLYTKTASGGSITAPVGSDPSIHARSATLGDPLSAGMYRYYYVYYRDPSVLGGCSASSTFNATQTLQVLWRT